MVDIKLIRENPVKVQNAVSSKEFSVDIRLILEKDRLARDLGQEVQKLREERNKFTASIKGKPTEEQLKEGKKIKEELDRKESELKTLHEELNNLLLQVPAIPKPDVKVGKNESENEVLKKWGEPTKFNFTPLDHLTLGEKLDVIDVQRAAKVSGTRFYYLKNELVLLQFALKQLAFETLTKEGFIPLLPPVMIRQEIMRSLGYMERGGDEDMYLLPKDNLVLVGTAEHSIVSMHKDETFNEKELPKRYVGFSTSFRRESGSYGKDTRGIIRVHQFDKVEMVSFVKKGDDDKEHEYLLSLEEKLLQMLNLPYQVVKMVTGDLGFPAERKYDIEVWVPSENKYRELTSTSTTGDFQSRRLNIKYLPAGRQVEKNKTEYVNILNGTAFSTRPLVAILENFQQEDGSVLIPEVLHKYLSFASIKSKR